jgi:hypothetical protein
MRRLLASRAVIVTMAGVPAAKGRSQPQQSHQDNIDFEEGAPGLSTKKVVGYAISCFNSISTRKTSTKARNSLKGSQQC